MALDPLGDDAGAGHDASDTALAPTPIGPGTYAGHVARPHDLADHYLWQGRAGDVLTWTIAGHPSIHASLNLPDERPDRVALGGFPIGSASEGRPGVQLLPYDGPYILRVALQGSVLDPDEAAYTLGVSAAPAGAWVHAGGTNAWHVAELAIDEPGDYHIFRVWETPVGAEPGPIVTGLEHDLGPHGFRFAGSMRKGVETDVVVEGHGVQLLPSGPDTRTSLFVNRHGTLGDGPVTGHVRAWTLASDVTTRAHVFIWSSGAGRGAAQSGDDTIRIRDEAMQGNGHESPVHESWGARTADLHIEDRVIGVFDGGPGGGRLTAPDATEHATTPGRPCLLLVDGEPGTWQLHLEPTSSTASGRGSYAFVGFEVPSLGVAALRLSGATPRVFGPWPC